MQNDPSFMTRVAPLVLHSASETGKEKERFYLFTVFICGLGISGSLQWSLVLQFLGKFHIFAANI
jgi:hypothetical protein